MTARESVIALTVVHRADPARQGRRQRAGVVGHQVASRVERQRNRNAREDRAGRRVSVRDGREITIVCVDRASVRASRPERAHEEQRVKRRVRGEVFLGRRAVALQKRDSERVELGRRETSCVGSRRQRGDDVGREDAGGQGRWREDRECRGRIRAAGRKRAVKRSRRDQDRVCRETRAEEVARHQRAAGGSLRVREGERSEEGRRNTVSALRPEGGRERAAAKQRGHRSLGVEGGCVADRAFIRVGDTRPGVTGRRIVGGADIVRLGVVCRDNDVALAVHNLRAPEAGQAVVFTIAKLGDAGLRADFEAFIVRAGDQVDHAADRVRAVDRAAGAGQNVNPLQHLRVDRSQVDLRAGSVAGNEHGARVRRDDAAAVEQGQRALRAKVKHVREGERVAVLNLRAAVVGADADDREGFEHIDDVRNLAFVDLLGADLEGRVRVVQGLRAQARAGDDHDIAVLLFRSSLWLGRADCFLRIGSEGETGRSRKRHKER